MRQYLSTLHTRSDQHKKNFALLVSGGFTLSMFAIWTFVNFGQPVVKEDTLPTLASTQEVGPFESLLSSVGSAWDSLTSGFGELKDSLSGIDVESGYIELKTKSLDIYGR